MCAQRRPSGVSWKTKVTRWCTFRYILTPGAVVIHMRPVTT